MIDLAEAPRRAYPATPAKTSDPWAEGVVWATWLGSFVSALVLVLLNGRDVPVHEDFNMIPAMAGQQTHFLSWLWVQNNEHRVPLPKLIYLGLLKLWPDFRVGMVFNIVLFAAMAAGFIIVLRRLRGRTRWTDAFFPVAFLNLGNWGNMGWSWQMPFVIATALACGVLLAVASRQPFGLPRALGLGACLVGIPPDWCDRPAFAPIVALALIRRLRSGSRVGPRLVLLSSVEHHLRPAVARLVPHLRGFNCQRCESGRTAWNAGQ